MRTRYVAVVVEQAARWQPGCAERCAMTNLPRFHYQKPEYEREAVLVQEQDRRPLYFRAAHQLQVSPRIGAKTVVSSVFYPEVRLGKHSSHHRLDLRQHPSLIMPVPDASLCPGFRLRPPMITPFPVLQPWLT